MKRSTKPSPGEFKPGDILIGGKDIHRGASWRVLDPPYNNNGTIHAVLLTFSGGDKNTGTQSRKDWDSKYYSLVRRSTAAEIRAQEKAKATEEAIKVSKDAHDYYTQLTAITIE